MNTDDLLLHEAHDVAKKANETITACRNDMESFMEVGVKNLDNEDLDVIAETESKMSDSLSDLNNAECEIEKIQKIIKEKIMFWKA